MNWLKKVAKIIGAIADFFRAIGVLQLKTPVDLKDLKPNKPKDVS